MKKLLLSTLFSIMTFAMFAQCGELFISEYVEGYANNKALEIYNPTPNAVDLSQYSVARFSNGAITTPIEPSSFATLVGLPSVMLESGDVFVVVMDQRDMTQWNSQFDKPVWNGYNIIDTLFDIVTGMPLTDSLGNILTGPQYDMDNNALFGTTDYNEEYDLQGKADVFLCPEYEVNNAMYFNGNDAVALIKSQEMELPPAYPNVVDVIGVIGEDPSVTIGEPAWINADGFWMTRDRSLVRNSDVAGGVPGSVAFIQATPSGTFNSDEWTSYSKNTFTNLGSHSCVCTDGVATEDVNKVPFKMFPNPVQGEEIQISAEEAITQVEIFNVLGQNIFSEKMNTTTAQVATNNFDKGIYFVNVWFGNELRSVKKLIVD